MDLSHLWILSDGFQVLPCLPYMGRRLSVRCFFSKIEVFQPRLVNQTGKTKKLEVLKTAKAALSGVEMRLG